jgi:serine/threonine protein kinase
METIKNEQSSLGSCLPDFEIVKELGKGSYGTVYLAKPKSKSATIKYCVIKKIVFDQANMNH